MNETPEKPMTLQDVAISPVQCKDSPRSDCYTLQGNSREASNSKSGHFIHGSPILLNEDDPSFQFSDTKKKVIISGFSGVKIEPVSSYDTPIFRSGTRQLTVAFNNVADQSPVSKNSEILYSDMFQKSQYEYEYRDRPARKSTVFIFPL